MYVDHIENDILSNMLSTSNKDVIIISFIFKSWTYIHLKY